MRKDHDITIHIDIEDTRITFSIHQVPTLIDNEPLQEVPSKLPAFSQPDNKATFKAIENTISTIVTRESHAAKALSKKQPISSIIASPTLPLPPKEAFINGYKVNVQYEDNPNRQNIVQRILATTSKK